MKVTLYSSETCGFCKKVREFLIENKVKFKNIDIGKDVEKANELVEETGQLGVPVVIAGDEVVLGYDLTALKKALKLK